MPINENRVLDLRQSWLCGHVTFAVAQTPGNGIGLMLSGAILKFTVTFEHRTNLALVPLNYVVNPT